LCVTPLQITGINHNARRAEDATAGANDAEVPHSRQFAGFFGIVTAVICLLDVRLTPSLCRLTCDHAQTYGPVLKLVPSHVKV
jgi:hypothetical protein